MDDEDFGDNSGEGTSGDGEPHTTAHPSSNHPAYFRISFTVAEPYVEEFTNRHSFQYRDFTEDLVRDIEALYKDVPGTQSATVIKIE